MIKDLKRIIKKYLLKKLVPTGFYFSQMGYCPCCDKSVEFKSTKSWLRGYFRCSNCNSIPRQRALMLTLEKYYPDWRGLRIHETSPSKRGASAKLKRECNNYTETQFFPNEPKGKIIDGFRNEDLENQTFEDESFDLVISQDVMEHVYNPKSAFKEIKRTLKKGGAHIFTVPLINRHKPTQRWAELGPDGKPIFLFSPEYHGNPVDPEGSPVTMHWGYDIVSFIKENTDMDTIIEYIDDLRYGIRADFIEVLVSKKG